MMYNETYLKGFVWHNDRLNKNGDVFSWVRSDVIRMITLQKLCESLNILQTIFNDKFLWWLYIWSC